MAKNPLSWDDLRRLAAEAGREEDFVSFEQALGGNLKSALVNHYGLADRYLSDDTRFRRLIDGIIAVIVRALTHIGATPQTQTTDMDALQKIFTDEVEGYRG